MTLWLLKPGFFHLSVLPMDRSWPSIEWSIWASWNLWQPPSAFHDSAQPWHSSPGSVRRRGSFDWTGFVQTLEIAQNGNFHGEHFDMMINQWWSRCCRVGSDEPERSESNGLKVTKVILQSTGEETERFQRNSAVSLRVHLSCRFSINMLRNRLPALWNWCLLSRKERYTAQKLMDDDGCEWWWMWWWWMIVDDGRWWWMIVVVWCCFFGQSRDVAPARTQVCALRFQLLCSSTSLSTGPAGFQAHWKEPLLGLHGLRCLVGSCCCEFWSTLFSQSWNWRIDIIWSIWSQFVSICLILSLQSQHNPQQSRNIYEAVLV